MKKLYFTVFGYWLTVFLCSAQLQLTPEIIEAFNKRASEVGSKQEILNFVENQSLSEDEKKAMKFLYAYMPEPDIFGYSPDFFLENVKSTLKTKEELPWGKVVPEREFLHFVLPLRVNNESLDMCRPQFYDELKERVKGLSMEDAILEVNHWCHEKVTYKPSDGRTSSPLSSVSQAIGRCGEESTFTVAALRAVGIPARQVYTPRWAHTDDNHAWVEAWANGKWYFLGACEPEHVLNLAWFNAPASRGMLMNTNVFGHYDGPEEQLQQNDIVTSINVTENYAPVKEGRVIVKDKDGKNVENAMVRFGIYNYAEFYPVATRKTASDGSATLTSGLGDMVVWATDGKNFSLGQLKGNSKEPLVLTLDKNGMYNGDIRFDITPPPSRPIETYASEEQKKANAQRFAYEDSVRNAYMATFATPESAAADAKELGLDKDRLTKVLIESRGNHKGITEALRGMSKDRREIALSLLENVSEKDRRDIDIDVLKSHVGEFAVNTFYSEDINNAYILNPRVENERLVSYKKELFDYFPNGKRKEFIENPEKLAEWIEENIKDDSRWNPLNFRMDPVAVAKAGAANPLSKKIFFVAAMRSLGMPARMDLVRGEAQYLDRSGEWHDVLRAESADDASNKTVAKGKLKLNFTPQAYLKDPKYYTNFTISKIVDGVPRLQEYAEEATATQLFGKPAEVEAGQYMLITGQRLADGGVLADVKFFNVAEGETKEMPLEIREDDASVSVIGSLNAENIYHDIATGSDKSILSTTGRGYYVLGIIRNGHEPSVHTLNDISSIKGDFESLSKENDDKKKFIILLEDIAPEKIEKNSFPSMPSNLVFGLDKSGDIRKEISKSLNLPSDELPIFVIADSFNRIVFVSQGYTIGIGDQLIKTLKRIN